MQPYTDIENDWLSSVPLTPNGHIDVVAVEAAARQERARMLAQLVRQAFAWFGASRRRRAQAAAVQRELDRAALGIGR